MMSHRHGAKLLSVGVLVAILLGMSSDACARVVGILFDDSGSMESNIHLPTFGAQLLAATLDGRDGKDRLFTARLSQFEHAFESSEQTADSDSISLELPFPPNMIGPDNVGLLIDQAQTPVLQQEDIRTERRLQTTIEQIAEEWPSELGGTPYGPVEIMLEAITRSTGPDEEAFLIVLSDGAFHEQQPEYMPDAQTLRQNYERYKEKLEGSLTVFFVLTLNRPAAELIPKIEQQGVRSGLLDVFNGNPERGAYTVTDFDSLLDAMLDIIASVSATDLAERGVVVRPENEVISLDFPLSVTRIISLSIAEQGEILPHLVDSDFPVAERWDLTAMMRKSDNKAQRIEGWPTTKLVGKVSQLRLNPALEPGSYRMVYGAPVLDAVSLLFQTEVFLRWAFRDADGTIVASSDDAAGTPELIADAPYVFEVQLIDQVEAAQRVVDLATLPAATKYPTTVFDDKGRAENLELTIDDDRSVVSSPLVLSKPGDYKMITGLRLPSFASISTGPFAITAIEPEVVFDVAVESTHPCPSCDRGEISTVLTSFKNEANIARLTVIVTSARSGRFRLAPKGNLPSGLHLLDSDGKQHDTASLIRFEPGEPISFVLHADARWNDSLRGAGETVQELTLVFRAEAPQRGSARTVVRIKVAPPVAELVPTGHSQDPGGQQPLTLALDDLVQEAFVYHFFLRNALNRPKVEEFEVTVPGIGLLRGDVALAFPGTANADGYSIDMVPKAPWWCLCFLPTGMSVLTLSYRGPNGIQTASSKVPLRVQESWLVRVWSCLKLAMLFFAALWILLAIVNVFRTNRFPRTSGVVIIEHGLDFERIERLRKRNWTFARLLLWPFHPPHERRAIEGLTFNARSGGATLSTKRDWPMFKLQRLGRTLQEIAELRANTSQIDLIWDDTLQEMDSRPRILTIVSDYRNRTSKSKSARRR